MNVKVSRYPCLGAAALLVNTACVGPTGILLSGAGTITGGARAKAVLAAVAAATAGLSAKFADIALLQNADGTYSTYQLETAYPVGRLYVDRHEFGDTDR
jgi:hypothetical protein